MGPGACSYTDLRLCSTEPRDCIQEPQASSGTALRPGSSREMQLCSSRKPHPGRAPSCHITLALHCMNAALCHIPSAPCCCVPLALLAARVLSHWTGAQSQGHGAAWSHVHVVAHPQLCTAAQWHGTLASWQCQGVQKCRAYGMHQ